jgi:hypothetical protein
VWNISGLCIFKDIFIFEKSVKTFYVLLYSILWNTRDLTFIFKITLVFHGSHFFSSSTRDFNLIDFKPQNYKVLYTNKISSETFHSSLSKNICPKKLFQHTHPCCVCGFFKIDEIFKTKPLMSYSKYIFEDILFVQETFYFTE